MSTYYIIFGCTPRFIVIQCTRGDHMQEFKDRLRHARSLLHMTMEAFGESLGVSYNVIANYELGRVTPPKLFLNHMCSIYPINQQWLETGIGEPMLTDETLDDVCTQLRIVLAGMDPFKVDTIVKLARMPDAWWQDLKNQKGG